LHASNRCSPSTEGHQDETFAVLPHQDRTLQANLQDALGDLLHLLGIERRTTLHQHVRRSASLVVEPGGTSVSTHGLGYLFTALRRQGLIADEFVLQLTTFLRSLDLFLELIVLTTSTLTANQVRHGGKQGTHNPELSCHSFQPAQY
jgi:hypothetical protein